MSRQKIKGKRQKGIKNRAVSRKLNRKRYPLRDGIKTKDKRRKIKGKRELKIKNRAASCQL